MFTAILSFFTGLWGKVATYGAIAAVILALVGSLYWSIQHNAAENQLLKDQAAQQQAIINDLKRFQDQTLQLQKDADAQSTALQEQVAAIQANADAINKFLTSTKIAKSDRPASDLLKETLKQIEKLNK